MGAGFAAVICTAGSSTRMGGVKKEYQKLNSASEKFLTVLGASVSAFASFAEISRMVIVRPNGETDDIAKSFLPNNLLKDERLCFVSGGKSRRESVHNALLFLRDSGVNYVLIHDGARPWASAALIRRVMEAAVRHGAAVPVIPATDTPKQFDDNGFVTSHLRRKGLGFAQTPQGFAFAELLAAHEKARQREAEEGFEYTDDAEVWGEFAGQIAAVEGETENRKITYPKDLQI